MKPLAFCVCILLLSVSSLSGINWDVQGWKLLKSGKYNEAIEAFSKAIELNPKDAPSYDNRGHAYYMLGKHEQAIRDFDKAIEINPLNADAYNNRGSTYNALNQSERAIKDLNKAIQLRPDPDAYHNRGIANYKLGAKHLALKDFNKVIEMDQKYAAAYYLRGFIYWGYGQEREAQRDLKIAAKLGNKHAQKLLTSKGIAW